VVSLQDLFKIGTRSTVRVAVEYRNMLGNTAPVEAGNIGYSVIAPSAMWSYTASDRLSLTAAVRLDHLSMKRTGPEPEGFVVNRNSLWDRSFDSFSANLGAVFKISELETLRATYARGIQIPSMVEFGTNQAVLFVQGPFKLTVGGNPGLRPSVVSNYEMSYERSLPTLGAKAAVKAFYQHTDDVKGVPDFNDPVIATPPAIGAEIIDENASTSDMSGFELAASGKIGGGFHWSADTTYTRVTDKPFSGFDLIGRKVAYFRMTPKFRGNVALGWSNARWTADAYVHFVTAYDAIADFPGRLETTPGYATLGGRVSYLVSKGLTLAVSGQNLGAASQAQGLVSSFRAPRRVIVRLTRTW
jgi:iron complex outermembrane receptor protein